MIAALFVQSGGSYFGLADVDPWDEPRDARRYDGSAPVVAHPPCARWCKLAGLVQSRYGYGIGEDGGCFASALSNVRRCGGVLEHPAESLAWDRFGLLRPLRAGGWQRDMMRQQEWVCEVSQSAYGHPARKRTWLLYVGDVPPDSLDWTSPEPSAVVSHCSKRGDGTVFKMASRRLGKREASATPARFRDALIGLARGLA